MFPTRTLALLLAIGFVDLVSTALLHSRGVITELNPVMRPLIEHGEWLFALVKGGTLVLAWEVMRRQCPANLAFVRRSCLVGSGLYILIWSSWFTAASL